MVVAASLRTGLDAVNQVERVGPDVAVLDIEMPDLDGIAALPQLLAKKRDLVIIMASTLTRRNAEISFKRCHWARRTTSRNPKAPASRPPPKPFVTIHSEDPSSRRQGPPSGSGRGKACGPPVERRSKTARAAGVC